MTFNEYLKISNSIKKDNKVSGYKTVKIAILGSYTMDYIKPIMIVENYNCGIDAEIYIGQYNQYMQEVLNTENALQQFKPDIVILCIRLEELYPILVNDYLKAKQQYDIVVSHVYDIFDNLIMHIKNNFKSIVLINNFMSPLYNYSSLYDYQERGQIALIRELNTGLTKLVAKYDGAYCVDIENLVSKFGKNNILDNKMWYISKNPYKASFYVEMAKEYLRYEKAIYGLQKKCLVIDLDNTLWGGVVGEDGVEGIKLGDNYPGNVFKDFQREILKLKCRGVILAINSKNNYSDAIQVFKMHRDMLLKLDDFSCVKINWNDKASNIIEISKELNISLNSIVFIDDNPVECQLVKSVIPQVEVINLPDEVMEYSKIINSINFFECLNLTEEDTKKTEMYKAQFQREKAKEAFFNVVDYYKSLDMEIGIEVVDSILIQRITQLTQKTNQFNLTTKRYTENQLRNMMDTDKYLLYSISLKDKYGDYGIIGCCIINRLSRTEWYIDTFLLSCRAMNRTVENKFMNFLLNEARNHGIHLIIGEYIPSKKNAPIKNFLKDIGFDESDGKFVFDVNNKTISDLDYFKLTIKDDPKGVV